MNFLQSLFGKKQEQKVAHQQVSYTEKRKHQRWPIHEKTFLYPQRRPPVQAQLVEISQGGVRLELREPLPLDSRGELALYCGGVVSKTTIRLIWEIKGKAGYVYGADFVDLDPRQKGLVVQYIRLVTGQ